MLVNLEFDYDLFRWLGSLLGITLMLISSQALSNYICQSMDENEFSKIIMLFTLIILLAFLAVLGFNPFFINTEFRTFDKPMFVYGEPSHFSDIWGIYFIFSHKFKI